MFNGCCFIRVCCTQFVNETQNELWGTPQGSKYLWLRMNCNDPDNSLYETRFDHLFKTKSFHTMILEMWYKMIRINKRKKSTFWRLSDRFPSHLCRYQRCICHVQTEVWEKIMNKTCNFSMWVFLPIFSVTVESTCFDLAFQIPKTISMGFISGEFGAL